MSINNRNYNSNNNDMTLEQRIARALTDPNITAGQLAELITETEQGIVDADTIANRLQEVAFDPIESPDAAKALKAVQFAQFVAKRLRNVLPRLEQRNQQIIAQERCTRRPR